MKRQGHVVPGNTSDSQTGVLRREVDIAGIRHGDVARVRVNNVEAEDFTGIGRKVFFCRSDVDILEMIQEGDGKPIPQELVEVPKMGHIPKGRFDIEGILASNGRLTLTDVRVVTTSRPKAELAAVLPHVGGSC